MNTPEQIANELKKDHPDAAARVAEFFEAEMKRLADGDGYYGEDIDYLAKLREMFL